MRIPKPCVRLSICPYPEKRYHPSFVNISPTLVIDTSMERSSRVLHHGNPKIWFFFSKKFEIVFDLYFKLCWRSEIIQVGLNMHLYDDIGDASSSLWGSTSSYLCPTCFRDWWTPLPVSYFLFAVYCLQFNSEQTEKSHSFLSILCFFQYSP